MIKKKPGERSSISWMVIGSNIFAHVAHPHQFQATFFPTETRFELRHALTGSNESEIELVGSDYKSFAELDSAARRIIVGDLNNPRGM